MSVVAEMSSTKSMGGSQLVSRVGGALFVVFAGAGAAVSALTDHPAQGEEIDGDRALVRRRDDGARGDAGDGGAGRDAEVLSSQVARRHDAGSGARGGEGHEHELPSLSAAASRHQLLLS